MTSISEAFEVPASLTKPASPGSAVVRKVAHESVAAGRVRHAARLVADDVSQAWPWRASAPSPYDLWQARIPAIERVPAQNKALWVAWVVFNHAALAVSVLLAVPLWVLGHPARILLAALITAPLTAMWLI